MGLIYGTLRGADIDTAFGWLLVDDINAAV
jgi:hypothetical protein